jgi:hypothetical protein
MRHYIFLFISAILFTACGGGSAENDAASANAKRYDMR